MELTYLEKLNDAQLRAVKENNNCVVSAGAGSGKTRVLAKRFIYLLLERKIPIEKIVALTFTKKAALEMRERIYTELVEVRSVLDDNAKRAAVDAAIENFSKANISTLDSFCSTIARNGCRRFGISPDFAVDQNAAYGIIETTALEFFLEHRDDENLIDLIGNSLIDSFVDSFLVAFLKLTTVTKKIDIEKSKKLFDKGLRNIFETQMNLYRTHAEIILSADDDALKDAKILTAQQILQDISEVPEKVSDPSFAEFCETISRFKNISFTGGQPKDEIKKSIRASIKYIRDEFCNTIQLIHTFFTTREKNFKVFDLLGILQDDVITKKRIQGVFTYADIAQLAIDCLVDDIDLRNFYKNEYDAIMIDEFQDNNSLQRDLLFLLSEKKELHSASIPPTVELAEDKLFFVGDDKQSIYLFRDADVSVFKKLSDAFVTDTPINLDTNYRSEKNLIQFFNFAFARVFYSEENPAGDMLPEEQLLHEARFVPIKSHRETPNVFPSVMMLTCENFKEQVEEEPENFLDKNETEAFILAKKISEMVQTGVTVRDNETNQARPCRYSDFAILFKSTTYQTTVERFLRRAEIPYQSVQQKGIFYDAPINDLLALIQLALHPDDRLAFAQVLRSPFVSLDDEDFAALFLANDSDNPLDAFAAESAQALSNKAQKKFYAARELFLRTKKYVVENTCTELISKLWYDEGYRYLLLQNADYQRYLELYDYLFEIARLADAQSASVQDFLTQVRAYISNEDKLDDMDIPVPKIGENKNAVTLLTIHKSKGLEFPIVCIPFCANGGVKMKLESKIFYSEKYGLSINMENDDKTNNNIFFNELVAFEKFKASAELKRLLYVGLTRAENHIIMTGIKTRQETDSFYYLLNTVLQSKDSLDASLKNILRIEEITPITKRDAYAVENNAAAPEKKYDVDFFKLPVKSFSPAEKKFFTASHLADADFDYENFSFDNEPVEKKTFEYTDDETETITAADLGTLTHAAIEARFHNMSFPLPKREEAKIIRWCENFFNSELGVLASADSMRKTEYGFITRYEGKTVVGKADLIFRHRDVLYIVDYKTDAVENPDMHVAQLSVYKKACSILFAMEEEKIRAFIFYLRSGHAVEV